MQAESTDKSTLQISDPDFGDIDFSSIEECSDDELELLDDSESGSEAYDDQSAKSKSLNTATQDMQGVNSSSEEVSPVTPVTKFRNRFLGYMELHADRETVIKYLDAHHGWFCRCAHPMRAELIAENGYALGIGWIGSLGYKIDPRIGLDLLPQDQGIYRIKTIPIPEQAPQGYDVDFQAVMELMEKPLTASGAGSEFSLIPSVESGAEPATITTLTSVEWQLDLTVTLQFPKFIHRLPQKVIQTTGDSVLAKVVKTISHRLTTKVQEDFHKTMGVKVQRQTNGKLFQRLSIS